MSSSNITELLEYWSLSAAKDDTSAPYDSCRTLYTTIDAIQYGDAPWQCMSAFGAPLASDDDFEHAASWKTQEYNIWYRDPDVVIRNLLDNPDFASQFDTTPYIATDAQGRQRWKDVMSGHFAWRRSVCSFVLSLPVLFYITNDLCNVDRTRYMKIIRPLRAPCTAA